MGCTAAIVFTCFGAAYGTAKAGVGVSATGVLRPDLIVKSMYYVQVSCSTTDLCPLCSSIHSSLYISCPCYYSLEK